MKWDYGLEETFDTSASGDGLFICNEGNFQYGNATLSYYNPETKVVENEVFYRANAMKLGDRHQYFQRSRSYYKSHLAALHTFRL